MCECVRGWRAHARVGAMPLRLLSRSFTNIFRAHSALSRGQSRLSVTFDGVKQRRHISRGLAAFPLFPSLRGINPVFSSHSKSFVTQLIPVDEDPNLCKVENVRNIAVIAHVDHGKTTLVDGLLQHTGIEVENDRCSLECDVVFGRHHGLTRDSN